MNFGLKACSSSYSIAYFMLLAANMNQTQNLLDLGYGLLVFYSLIELGIQRQLISA